MRGCMCFLDHPSFYTFKYIQSATMQMDSLQMKPNIVLLHGQHRHVLMTWFSGNIFEDQFWIRVQLVLQVLFDSRKAALLSIHNAIIYEKQ